jgi:hypothetical protein
MRKLLTAVIAIGILATVQAASFAVFTPISQSVQIASVTFTAQGVVNMNPVLYSVATGLQTNQIVWNPANITLGQTVWQGADTYMVITATITNSTGGIQIYSDNRNNGIYAYTTTGSTTSSPAGLISQSSTTQALPMCWRVSAVSTYTVAGVETDIVPGGAPNYHLYSKQMGGIASSFPCWVYLLDKTGPGYVATGGGYQEIWDSVLGIQFAEATWGQPGTPQVYVYFGASFAGATTPNTYQTTTLRVEAYHE